MTGTLPAAAALAIAGAAAVAGAAAARADGWTFTQDPGSTVDIVQSPARSQLEWVLPGSFTNGADTVHGELYIRPTGGEQYQPDFQFDTPGYRGPDGDPSSAVFGYGSQTGSGYGVPAYFYSPSGPHSYDGSAGQFLTGGDGIRVGPEMAWLLGPADYSEPITASDALGAVDFTGSGIFGLDNQLPGGGDWTADYGEMTPVLYDHTPVWSFQNADFTNGDTTVAGAVYLNSAGLGTYDQQFVTGDALYDVKQWGLGLTNLYFDPGDGGTVVDMLKTPLGDWDLSWLSWLLTPAAYSDTSAEATGVLDTMLTDPALSGTIEFGMSVIAAGA